VAGQREGGRRPERELGWGEKSKRGRERNEEEAGQALHGPHSRRRGVGLGKETLSPRVALNSLSPSSPARSKWTQTTTTTTTTTTKLDTQAASKRGETVYQVGAGAVSTVSTHIYTYLHRLQAGSLGSSTLQVPAGPEATQSQGEQ
jgi:hypothetical protein